MKKEQVYINLQGKSKEELTDLYWLLKNNNEEILNDGLDFFIRCYLDPESKDDKFHFYSEAWSCAGPSAAISKQEVTIEQLKEILQPMEKEFDLSMCRITVDNAEQSKKIQQYAFAQGFYWISYGKITGSKPKFLDYKYYYFDSTDNSITYCDDDFNNGRYKELHFSDVFKESLQEKATRLENELKEVKQQIEEKNNIKIGDWVKRTYNGIELFKADDTHDYRYINSEKRVYQKITNPELIKLIEDETNENNLFR